jgi:hypothetical protein
MRVPPPFVSEVKTFNTEFVASKLGSTVDKVKYVVAERLNFSLAVPLSLTTAKVVRVEAES